MKIFLETIPPSNQFPANGRCWHGCCATSPALQMPLQLSLGCHRCTCLTCLRLVVLIEIDHHQSSIKFYIATMAAIAMSKKQRVNCLHRPFIDGFAVFFLVLWRCSIKCSRTSNPNQLVDSGSARWQDGWLARRWWMSPLQRRCSDAWWWDDVKGIRYARWSNSGAL